MLFVTAMAVLFAVARVSVPYAFALFLVLPFFWLTALMAHQRKKFLIQSGETRSHVSLAEMFGMAALMTLPHLLSAAIVAIGASLKTDVSGTHNEPGDEFVRFLLGMCCLMVSTILLGIVAFWTYLIRSGWSE